MKAGKTEEKNNQKCDSKKKKWVYIAPFKNKDNYVNGKIKGENIGRNSIWGKELDENIGLL